MMRDYVYPKWIVRDAFLSDVNIARRRKAGQTVVRAGGMMLCRGVCDEVDTGITSTAGERRVVWPTERSRSADVSNLFETQMGAQIDLSIRREGRGWEATSA